MEATKPDNISGTIYDYPGFKQFPYVQNRPQGTITSNFSASKHWYHLTTLRGGEYYDTAEGKVLKSSTFEECVVPITDWINTEYQYNPSVPYWDQNFSVTYPPCYNNEVWSVGKYGTLPLAPLDPKMWPYATMQDIKDVHPGVQCHKALLTGQTTCLGTANMSDLDIYNERYDWPFYVYGDTPYYQGTLTIGGTGVDVDYTPEKITQQATEPAEFIYRYPPWIPSTGCVLISIVVLFVLYLFLQSLRSKIDKRLLLWSTVMPWRGAYTTEQTKIKYSEIQMSELRQAYKQSLGEQTRVLNGGTDAEYSAILAKNNLRSRVEDNTDVKAMAYTN